MRNAARNVDNTCCSILQATLHTCSQEAQESRRDKEYGGECEVLELRPFFKGLGVEECLAVRISRFDFWSIRVGSERGNRSKGPGTMVNTTVVLQRRMDTAQDSYCTYLLTRTSSFPSAFFICSTTFRILSLSVTSICNLQKA